MTHIEAPSWADVQLLAQNLGYAVRVDPKGFHIRNTNTGASRTVSTIADVIDTVCRKAL